MPDEQWTEVTGAPINLKKLEGQPQTGVYIGTEERAGKFGRDFIHSFIGEDSIPWSCYGMTSLDRVISRIPSGTKVRITFKGLKPTKDGKRTFNDVSVQVPQGVKLADEDHDGSPPPLDPDDVPNPYPAKEIPF